jgi:hypothetical protein
MVAALVEEAERIMAEGIDARLAAADASAAEEAEAARAEVLERQGSDVNAESERIARIQEIAG